METGAIESSKERAKWEKAEMQKKKDAAKAALRTIRDGLEKSGTLNVPFGSAGNALTMIGQLYNNEALSSFGRKYGVTVKIIKNYKGARETYDYSLDQYERRGTPEAVSEKVDEITKKALAAQTPKDIIGRFYSAISKAKVRNPAPR